MQIVALTTIPNQPRKKDHLHREEPKVAKNWVKIWVKNPETLLLKIEEDLLLHHPCQQSMKVKAKWIVKTQLKISIKNPKALLLKKKRKISSAKPSLPTISENESEEESEDDFGLQWEARDFNPETTPWEDHFSETDSDASPIKKMPKNPIPGTLQQILMEMMKLLIIMMSHK